MGKQGPRGSFLPLATKSRLKPKTILFVQEICVHTQPRQVQDVEPGDQTVN